MSLAEDVPLALFTMVVGAILGAVLTPLGDSLTTLLLERKKKSRNLHSAFLLFFGANGIWIIGEIFVEMFVRPAGSVGWLTAIVIASIFGLAAFTFAIGFKHLPNTESGEVTVRNLASALRLLIIGNFLWISGEIIETIAWEISPDPIYSIAYPATIVRLIFLLTAVFMFGRGGLSAWRAMSIEVSTNTKSQPSTKEELNLPPNS